MWYWFDYSVSMFKLSSRILGFGSYVFWKQKYTQIHIKDTFVFSLCNCVNLTEWYCPLHIVECYFLFISKQYLTDTIRVCIEIQMIRTLNWVISSYWWTYFILAIHYWSYWPLFIYLSLCQNLAIMVIEHWLEFPSLGNTQKTLTFWINKSFF